MPRQLPTPKALAAVHDISSLYRLRDTAREVGDSNALSLLEDAVVSKQQADLDDALARTVTTARQQGVPDPAMPADFEEAKEEPIEPELVEVAELAEPEPVTER